MYSKHRSIPIVVTAIFTDHPTNIIKENDGTEVATISKYLSPYEPHDSWKQVLSTHEKLH